MDFKITLDPVYTSKMIYGVFDLIKKEVISEKDKVLIIHTGGIQGIEGMNYYLKKTLLNLTLKVLNFSFNLFIRS